MADAEIVVARQRADIYVGRKPRKIVFIYGARPTPSAHCTARIKNSTLIVTGSCYAEIIDRVLATNGSCGAAIENNILYAVGG